MYDMSRYNTSRTAPVALVLIIAVLAIAALVSITRAIFFSGSQQPTSSQVDVSQTALLSTSFGHAVRMTVRGAIVADEDFHTYTVEITPSSRSLTTYTGYMDQTVDQQVSLDNNIPAYEQLVYSLRNASLVKGTELTGDQNDTRGICATGRLYQFEVLNADKSVKTLWTSTCKGSPGSLNASVTQLTNLFISQIPNASSLIDKIGV